MAGLVPAIHVFAAGKEDVDARMRGHDGAGSPATNCPANDVALRCNAGFRV
jgi:hypothetical protein